VPINKTNSLREMDGRAYFGPEVAHEALDGPRGGVAEGADRAAFDLFTAGGKVFRNIVLGEECE
jgi:hypothetical protein